MSSSRQLLIVNNSRIRGGGERYALLLAGFARRAGWSVGFIAPPGAAADAFAAAGFPVEHADWGWSYAKTLGLGALVERRAEAIRSAVDGWLGRHPGPTVVFPHYLREKLALTGWLRGRGVPVLWTEHGVLPGWVTLNPVLRAGYARAAAAAGRIIAISRATAASVAALGGPADRTTVIYNGVEVPAAIPPRGEFPGLFPDRDRIRIGMVSSLTWAKGTLELTDLAWDWLGCRVGFDLGRRVSFYFAGDGNAIGEVRQLAARYPEQVKHLGYVEETEKLYAALDLTVSPSRGRGEGIPLRVMESMALGRPVVATDVGGTREIIDPEKNGVLVPPRDWHRLSDELEKLAGNDDYRRRLGAAAHATARERFPVGKMEAASARVLAELVP